ncbi:MAG: FHA domain-containing protein [Vicinamibacteria bacterium]
MIIVCASCQARYKFDESKLGQRPRARTKCAKCGSAIDIENPLFGAMTLPPSPEAAAAPGETPTAPAAEETTRKTKTISGGVQGVATSRDLFANANLELGEGKRYSLAVLQGPATGQIFPISKPRVVIGRAGGGGDVQIDDAEASRQHAAVEILGDHAIVRDLGSTNGTFVDSLRIQQEVLQNQGEFRIGSHVLMFIVTEVE